MWLFSILEALLSLHEGNKIGIIIVHRGGDVVQSHETMHTKACRDVVDRQLHLMWAEYRVPTEGICNVVCFSWNPCDGETEVQEFLPDLDQPLVV